MSALVAAAVGSAVRAVQLGVGLVFIFAGVQKLLHRQEFRGIVAAYRLLPALWVWPVAILMGPLEVLLGGAAVLYHAGPYAALAMAVMLAGFAAVMALSIRRGLTDIHCGCFRTALRQKLRWRLVVRNLVCALALGVAAIAPIERVPLLLSAAAGITFFVLYVALDGVWALDASRRVALGRV